MPDKYAIAKVAFPNPSEGHVSKNSIKNSMPHDRPYYTFDIHESHLSSIIFTLIHQSKYEKIIFPKGKNFPIGYLEFPTGIKELFIEI